MSNGVSETGLNLIPAGYKQTEVGVIPEDWEVVEFGSALKEFRNGYAFSASGYASTGTPIITMAQIGLSGSFQFDISKVNKWDSEQQDSLKEFWVRDGDLLIAMTDVTPDKNLIGQMAIAKLDGIALLNQRVGLLRLKNEIAYSGYFSFLSCLPVWKTYCKGVASLGVQANIGTSDIRKAKVPLPTVKEQTAIANALSDVDALISELEKLIAKKQAIKTATMQQLLTGRTRLPQFALREDGTPKGTKPSELGEIPEDWEILGLGALFQPSVSKKPIKPKSLVSFVGMQDVTEQAQLSTQHLLAIENVKSGFTYFERGDVLVAKITPCFENGKGCHTETLSTDIGFGSTEFHVLRATDNSDSRFIYYWSNRNVFRKSLESEMVGSAGHRRVPLSAIAKYTIPVPPKEEQTAIATILSDMDAEIQALEQRLGKTRQIKQGMMQELLTGKTRLVQPLNKESQHG